MKLDAPLLPRRYAGNKKTASFAAGGFSFGSSAESAAESD
jgi:hypothetical protein